MHIYTYVRLLVIDLTCVYVCVLRQEEQLDHAVTLVDAVLTDLDACAAVSRELETVRPLCMHAIVYVTS